MHILSQSARWILRSLGYDLIKRDFAPIGYDLINQIQRMSRRWNYPIKSFFDVGANVGQTAERALVEFPDAIVFAFEPHPITFASLTANLGAKERFRPFNLALGTKVGAAAFFEYPGHPLINSMIDDAPFAVHFPRESKRIAVRVHTIDQFCSEQNLLQIDVLKIDTEGFDLFVLEGARRTLQDQKIKFIYTEFNDVHPKEGSTGGSLAAIDEFLHPFGYRFIASYTDWFSNDGKFFLVANALFALPPSSVRRSAREPS